MEGEKGTVCVTGGTGYVASCMIKRLLRRVTQSMPPLEMTQSAGAAEKLKIFNADLSDPDSFDAAIEGCKGVLHVAAPIDLENKEPEEVLTKRSINGALGIFKARLKSNAVKRVVYTSNAPAVFFNDKDADMMDESFWTDVGFARDNLDPSLSSYVISKTLTERAALEFAAEHGLDVVSVVPTYVVGPFIRPKLPDTLRSPLHLVLVAQLECIDLSMSMVHIDDLARAHISLLEYPDAKGRYNCSTDTISLQKIAEILLPSIQTFQFQQQIPWQKSKEQNYLLNTGYKFKYRVEEMFDGAIRCCKERGYLQEEGLEDVFESVHI